MTLKKTSESGLAYIFKELNIEVPFVNVFDFKPSMDWKVELFICILLSLSSLAFKKSIAMLL